MRKWSYERENTNHYSPEVREWAVRLMREYQGEYASEWATIQSIVVKIDAELAALEKLNDNILPFTGHSQKLLTERTQLI
ncbi:hypothetical protein B0F87_1044 [Methylobacter tundripaludum]|uniref:Uncharacterized protein n=1 Tax=Methylobacter tundripaludum TaxID=173365 RepID=A0A2S6HEL7_9GAMM|nr:hypothetical protein [Methylobacter tundripaludum]PPK75917.1 hypothetical protein B0F87_1044 [Methylobacter tundripaludum]